MKKKFLLLKYNRLRFTNPESIIKVHNLFKDKLIADKIFHVVDTFYNYAFYIFNFIISFLFLNSLFLLKYFFQTEKGHYNFFLYLIS